MVEWTTVASGLRFPEGPVAMADGSVIVVEIEQGRITRVRPDGSSQVIATPGGGPNGLLLTLKSSSSVAEPSGPPGGAEGGGVSTGSGTPCS